jgi:hypothetical protein
MLISLRHPAAYFIISTLLTAISYSASADGIPVSGALPEADRSRYSDVQPDRGTAGLAIQTVGGMMPAADVRGAGPRLIRTQGGQGMSKWTVVVRVVPRGASSGSQTNVTVTAGSEAEARMTAVAEVERKKPGHAVTAVSARKISG